MIKKNYKTEIIFTNVLLCILVVFIHVSSHPVSNLQKDSLAYLLVMIPWRLSAFVVQGFIFLASFKIFIKDEIIDYKKYYITRLKKIVVPYIIWVMVYYLYFCRIGYFPFSLKALGKYILVGNIVSPFYFIIAIIQFYALMPFWQKIYRKVNPIKAVALSLVLMVVFKEYFPKAIYVLANGYSFPYTDRLFPTYLVFWTLGSVCGLHYEKFKKILKSNTIKIVIGFAIIAVINAYFSYETFALGRPVSFLENLHMFYCIVAIMACLAVGLYVKENKVLLALNSITFEVFLSHCFVMQLVNDKMASVGITSIAKSYVIRFFAVYVLTIGLCLLYNKFKVYHKKIL